MSLYSNGQRWAEDEINNYHMQMLSAKGESKEQGKGIENCQAHGGDNLK